jgi:hypothetical protein
MLVENARLAVGDGEENHRSMQCLITNSGPRVAWMAIQSWAVFQ